MVPSVTEIIYAVGAEEYLRGNTTFCDFPEAAKNVYKVGDYLRPDWERIVALKPDLVFLTLPAQQEIAEKLSEAGIKYYVSQPRTIDDILQEIDSVAKLLGRQVRGNALVESLKAILDSIPAYRDTPRVYVEVSDVPLLAAGARSFLSSLLLRAGGRNIYDHTVVQEYPLVDPEFVIRSAPDVILLLYPGGSAHELRQRVGWAAIPAVKNGRVYEGLDLNLFSRPGPRFAQAVWELVYILHPESRPEEVGRSF